MQLAGSSASWAAANRLRAQGVPPEQVAAEVKAWRKSGWEPSSPFTRDMLSAFAARQAGAPDSAVEGLIAPWLHRYGSGAVADAFVRMHRASQKLADQSSGD